MKLGNDQAQVAAGTGNRQALGQCLDQFSATLLVTRV
jgi:hypothetical protein